MKLGKQLTGPVLLILAVMSVVLLNKGVPLYDGIGFPDEAYRYVNPPTAATKTPLAPTGASSKVDFSKGTNQDYINLASQETAPQVSIQIPPSSISTSPPVTAKIELDVAPLAPDKDTPPNGRVAGNIYKFMPHPDDHSQSFRYAKERVSYIALRLPQGFPAGAAIDWRPAGGNWQILDTIRVGNDIYQAAMPGSGDYALISNPAAAKTKSSDKSKTILVISLLIVFGLVSLVITTIRLSSKKPKKKT
jgi:hypothetical protein